MIDWSPLFILLRYIIYPYVGNHMFQVDFNAIFYVGFQLPLKVCSWMINTQSIKTFNIYYYL